MIERGTAGSNDSSDDTFFDGRVRITQPVQGYRFAIDSPLLVWFAAAGRSARRCADLGAGSGVIGIGLLAAGAVETVVAVEIQTRLAALGSSNARANALTDRFEMVVGDLREPAAALADQDFDLVVINPPFWPVGKGRLPENEERRIACHELHLTLDEWVAVSRRLLHQRRGRLCAVFPARRLDELLASLGRNGLSTTRLRPVYPRDGEAAELTLLEARPGAAGRLEIEPPLVLERADGSATAAARDVLDGQFSSTLRGLPDRRQD